MTSRLGVVLQSLLNSAGVVAAVHLDRLGYAVHAPTWRGADLSAAGARARDLLEQWKSVGQDLRTGGVVSMLLDGASGPVTITPLPDEGALVVMGDQDCQPGRVRAETRRATAAIAAVTPEAESGPPPAPLQVDQPDPMAALRDRDARARASPIPLANAAPVREREASPRTGEIVLLGAHTFRCVRKLVAHLLETKGVRAACLRAYSPANTVVDVVLDGGTTLAAIEPDGLEEFAVERTEETRGRLVLRPAKGRVALRRA